MQNIVSSLLLQIFLSNVCPSSTPGIEMYLLKRRSHIYPGKVSQKIIPLAHENYIHHEGSLSMSGDKDSFGSTAQCFVQAVGDIERKYSQDNIRQFSKLLDNKYLRMRKHNMEARLKTDFV
jgi:hypothetical protein